MVDERVPFAVERNAAAIQRGLGAGQGPRHHGPFHPASILGLQPPHHPLHPLLPDVGVNPGGGDALVAGHGLDVHPFGTGVQQMGGVSVLYTL